MKSISTIANLLKYYKGRHNRNETPHLLCNFVNYTYNRGNKMSLILASRIIQLASRCENVFNISCKVGAG